ncbi:MAG: hypothetical protein AAFX40_18470, partial [Cyanobacteria bacterium J06639_1]
LLGLSAFMVGSKLLSNLAAPSRGARQVSLGDRYRPQMSLSEWVARAQQQMVSTGVVAAQSPVSISDSHADNVPVAEKLAA